MENDEIPTVNNSKSNKQSKAKKNAKKGLKKLLSNEKVRKLIITHIPQIAIAILIIIGILYMIGIIMFIIMMPGLVLGSIDEFGRNLLGNIQGILTGDSTTAKVSNEEILDLAQHLQAMGYDIQGYGLGSVQYENDGSTSSSRNGKAKEIEKITESVDGKHYLRSYIAANENTYVLSEWSIGGALESIGNNIIKGIDSFIDITPDNLKATSAEDFSTGMINIVGKVDSSIFESSNAKDYVSIDRKTKQMKIYSDALALPEFGFFGAVGRAKRLLTGDNKIQWGETFSYDLNNWVGRYGRPTEMFLALHLSTMMPDLTYEIATKQEFNTKVNMGLLDASVQFSPTATKGESTIDSIQIMRYFLQYCIGRTDIQDLSDKEVRSEFRKTTEDIIAMTIARLEASDQKIEDTEWTTAEIAELAAITHVGMNSSSNSSSNPSFHAVGVDNGNFKKYNLNDYQLGLLTYVAYKEQDSDAGAAAEASLMANLFELRRGGEGGAEGLVDYVINGTWFSIYSKGGTDNDPNHKEIIRQVLVNGKHTLPEYVDEHDCFSDIPSATNNGNPINVSDRSAYVKDTTIINNRYGSTYTFYTFPEENSDPFGYHEKFGSDFHYVYDPESESTTSSTPSTLNNNNSNSGDAIPYFTGVSISKNEFVKKCEDYNQRMGNREYAQYAGLVYDICVKNNINPVINAAQAMVEQGWNSPNIAQHNFWGLGILPDGTNVYGSLPMEEYVQLWCDTYWTYIKGEANENFSAGKAASNHSYAVAVSQQYHAIDPEHFTGNMKSIYDVYGAYNGFGTPGPTVDYVDNHVFKFAKDIFGEDILDDDSGLGGGGNGIDIKWPFIASVTNHWFYDDIDFTKDVYRFAKAATKTMDYIPDDENNILNKNHVSVKLDSVITSNMGVMYQVAEPEAIGPNKNIVDIFSGEYYKYDGSTDRAKKIEMKKAKELGKNTFEFNGEKDTVKESEIKDITKEKVSFKENKPEALTAFGILENMHTEASDYIYRDLKELMIYLRHFTTAELTEDLQNILMWPIKTDNKDRTWQTSMDQNNFGTTIKCTENNNIVLSPSTGIVKEIEGDSITLELTTLDDEATEILEYIYKHKDPFKKINRDLLTGFELTIDNIEPSTNLIKGDAVKRGQQIGKAKINNDKETSITITLYQLDKSVVENISTYLRQEDNNKYEDLMKAKKEAEQNYDEGLDISSLVESNSGNWSGEWKQYYQGDYPGYPWGGGELPGWGCGPTSFAMVATHIAGKDIDPPAATQWCGPNAYTVSVGTTYDYFPAAANHFNLNCDVETVWDTGTAIDALKKGFPVISSQGPGLFTSGGHFIVLAEIDSGNNIRVLDPNKYNAVDKGYNDRRFSPDEIDASHQAYFIFKKR